VADLRKLKDAAALATEKRQYAKAAELYMEIAQAEGEPDWRQRAGEALRKCNRNDAAVEQLAMAVDGYARGGFLLKAVAVCKVILQVDPRHTATQTELARLYAVRDRRTSSGEIKLDPSGPYRPTTARANAAPTPARSSSSGMPVVSMPGQPASGHAVHSGMSLGGLDLVEPGELPERDQFGRPRSPAAPEGRAQSLGGVTGYSARTPAPQPQQPMEALPLRSMLPSHKSDQYRVMPDRSGLTPDASVYEIDLDDDSLLEEIELTELPDPARHAQPSPVAPRPSIDDFDDPLAGIDLDDEDPLGAAVREASRAAELPKPPAQRAAPVAAPPVAPPPKAPAPAINDDLDFSSLMDDAAPLPPSRPVHAPTPTPAPVAPPELPHIPLFSSLQPDELQQLIEGVEVRDFPAGEYLMRQGERGDSLHVIVRGKVRVFLDGELPHDLATLEEGAFVGELAILTDFPRSASVQAETDTQTLEISRALIARVVSESPEVLKVLLRFFRDRMMDRFLRTSTLFLRFSTADARRLVASFRFLEVDANSRLVVEGQRSPGLFLLMCGEAVVQRRGVATPHAVLGPGDFCGEMSLLSHRAAMANVDARTKCWMLSLGQKEFQELILAYPQLLEFISELAAERESLV